MEDLVIPALLVAISLMAIALAGVAAGYVRVMAMVRRSEAVHEEPRQVMEEAQKRAVEIINGADLAARGLEEEFRAQVTRINSENAMKYQRTLDHAMSEVIRDIQAKNSEITGQLIMSVDAVQRELSSKAQEELSGLKARYEKKFQENLEEKSQALAQKILGRSITEEEHRRLVTEALEEAKRNGIF